MGLLKNLYTLWGFLFLIFFFLPQQCFGDFLPCSPYWQYHGQNHNFLVAYFIEIKSDFI